MFLTSLSITDGQLGKLLHEKSHRRFDKSFPVLRSFILVECQSDLSRGDRGRGDDGIISFVCDGQVTELDK